MNKSKKLLTSVFAVLIAIMMTITTGMIAFAEDVSFVKAGHTLVHQSDGTVNQDDYYKDGKTFMTDLGAANTIIRIAGISPTVTIKPDAPAMHDLVYMDPPNTTDYASSAANRVTAIVRTAKKINVSSKENDTAIEGSINALYKDAAQLSDGSKADLSVTYKNIKVRLLPSSPTAVNQTGTSYVVIGVQDMLHFGAYGESDDYANNIQATASYDVDVSVVKDGNVLTDSTFFVGTTDLDRAGKLRKLSNGKSYWDRDFDETKENGKAIYPESISLKKDTLPKNIFLTKSSYLKTFEKNGYLVMLPSQTDVNSYDSGFATLGKGTISLAWSGNTCTTTLELGNLLDHVIVAKTVGAHKDGGEITTNVLGYDLTTDNGTYNSYVDIADGNDAEYLIKVKDHYKLGKVTVDGSEITPTKVNDSTYKYTFTSVNKDHEIIAEFKGPNVTYEWDGDHPNKEVPASSLNRKPGDYQVDTTYKQGDRVDEAKGTQNGFWIFGGWDKTGTIQVLADTVIKGKWAFTPLHKVEYKADAGGSVTGIKQENVEEDKNPTGSSSKPDENYEFVNWTCNKGVTLKDQTVVLTGTPMTMAQIKDVVVKEDLIFTAHFKPMPKVQYVSDEHGSITGKNLERVNTGSNPTGTTESPEENYVTTHWTADIDLDFKDGSHKKAGDTFDGDKLLTAIITKDTVFTVHHAKDPKVTYESDLNGSITGKTFEFVTKNGHPTSTTEQPNEHYVTTNWTCDKDVKIGEETVTAGTPIKGEDITKIVVVEDITLTVHHETMPHVFYESDENGSITGKTNEYVLKGENPTGTTQQPNEHYVTTKWTCDKDVKIGESVAKAGDPIKEADITKITVVEDITLKVFHEAMPHVIYTSDEHGTITGKTSEYVLKGENPTGSTEEPAEHYQFVNWTCDHDVVLKNGAEIKTGNPMTINQIKNVVVENDLTFTAHNDPMPKVTYASDPHGAITGKDFEYVTKNSNPTGTTEKPDEHYVTTFWTCDKDVEISNKTVKAGDPIDGDEITDIIVAEDITLTVHHESSPHVFYEADEHGSITGKTNEYVLKGENPTGSSQEPEEHYEFVNWTCSEDVILTDDTEIKKGEPMTMAQIKTVIVEKDLTFTSHNRAMPKVTYESDENGLITGKTTEYVKMNDQPDGTTEKPNEHFITTNWTADTDLTFTDGSSVQKGTELTMDKIKTAVIKKDTTFIVHHEPIPHVVYNTDGHGTITGIDEEWVLKGNHPAGTTEKANGGYLFTYWTSDKIEPGKELTMDQIKDAVITEDTVFTAHYRAYPLLSVEKTADKDEYNVDDTIHFTIKTTQVVEDTYSTNVVITDKDITEGIKIDLDTVATDKGKIEKGENSFKVLVDKLDYNEVVTITFDATVEKETFASKEAENTAEADQEEPGGPFTGKVDKPVYYRVTTEVVHGTITPSDDKIVNGTDFNVLYSPETGYYLTQIMVDGKDIDLVDHYDFEKIKDNHKIKVVYSKIPDLEVVKEANKERVDLENDSVTYTSTISNIEKDSTAVNTVIEDKGIEGMKIDFSSIVLTMNGKTYRGSANGFIDESGSKTSDLDLSESGNGFKIKCNKEIAYGEKIKLTYKADVVGELPHTYIVDGELFAPSEAGYTSDESGTDVSVEEMNKMIAEGRAVRVFNNTISAIADGMTGPKEDTTEVGENTPELKIVKKSNKASVNVGEKIKYTIIISQIKPGMKATNVVMKDVVPEALSIDQKSVKISSGNITLKGQTITALIDSIESEDVKITYTTTAKKAGKYKNIAAVTSKQTKEKKTSTIVVVKQPVKQMIRKLDRRSGQTKTGDAMSYILLLFFIMFTVCASMFAKRAVPTRRNK